jgi:hypothetical protein
MNNYYKILRWMKAELRHNPEMYLMTPQCGEFSATTLAETAILEGVAGDDAWSDETHPVWDAAVDAIEQHEREIDDYVDPSDECWRLGRD